MRSTAIIVFANRAVRETKRFGLGARADARLAAFMVERTIATARTCSDVADIIVADDRMQRGDSFEERLMGVLEDVRARGYQRIVLIGADTVTLTASDLRTAVAADRAVVGPSADGGFYLLGIESSRIELLRGLPWQTARVGRELEQRLGAFRGLQLRQDVDNAADVRRLLEVLQAAFQAFCGVALANADPGPPAFDEGWQPTENLHTSPERPRGPPARIG